ncbi:TonB-dependent receptor [Emticicia sp. 21SJ11W-3]|uniref:SusC/RagA family TonB-linked outer membrane protein n=1 Tax=Emticicia sp. 21SJ11W-3 TaxID=2916755 RepID=UPI0020A07AE3|nr:TonB-dependent receptor [Emticicia sp. 21SJ11W-3]UTA68631.1 TonB-dependent receptor [Emticicia sp. 21SJ11W-3]
MKVNNYKPTIQRGLSRKSIRLLLFFLMSLFSVGSLMAQVRGVVKNENGEAFQGVNVVIKGETKGTVTDAAGRYEIKASSESVLIFSFLGYKPAEIRVGNQREINVTLDVDAGLMEEIVVVGYGTQKKSSLTGAVSSITNKELATQPVISATQAMQGRVAGVSIVNNSSPGAEPTVRIRGVGSISLNPNPLYVIDGVPAGGLNTIAPNDIESIEVLKDASASAIYGSRAANGVVLITTKKGKAGKLTISLDSYVGTQSAWKTLDLLNSEQYIKYGTALLSASGQPIPGRFSAMNTPIYEGATTTFAQTQTNWQDVMFKNGPIHNNQLSLAGGTEKSKFYLSLGNFKQEGILPFTEYGRQSIRLNSDHSISKYISIGQTMMVTQDKRIAERDAGGRSMVMNIMRMVPYWPVSDPTKLGGYSTTAQGLDATDPENPMRIAVQEQKDQIDRSFKMLGTVYAEVKFTNWLRYKFTMGGDYSSSIFNGFVPIYNDGNRSRQTAELTQNRGQYFSTILTNQLTFDKTFGKHYVNATAVLERQDATFKSINLTGQRPDNNIKEIQGAANINGNTSSSENTLLSYVGRLNYEYNSKYLLSATVRRDGSSKFAPGNKWGTFPSVSLGWRISEEAFMKDIVAINELKLRGSVGVTGYNSIGDYDWQPLISANNTNYSFGNASQLGSYFNSLGNTGLSWEETTMKNLGLDLSLFSNKVSISTEIYSRKTDGLLLRVPLPDSEGYSNSPLANVGSMENRGFELSLGYHIDKKDFKSTITGTFDLVRNKVLSLDTPNATINAGNNADFGGFDITRTEAGSSLQSFYGWQVEKIFQNEGEIAAANGADGNSGTPYQNEATKPGDIKFRDLNNDGKIDANDRTYLGSYLPKFSYGLNYSGTYKNFDFSLFFQGVQGNKIYNGTKVIGQGMLRLFNATTDVLNAWTPSNTNTDVPRAVSGDPNQNARTSDRFIEDGSYLRLKNLTVGYTIPSDKISKLTNNVLTRARIYFTSQNLLTFTKYSGYDPEIASRNGNLLTNGVDYGMYPQARTLTIGLNLGFN